VNDTPPSVPSPQAPKPSIDLKMSAETILEDHPPRSPIATAMILVLALLDPENTLDYHDPDAARAMLPLAKWLFISALRRVFDSCFTVIAVIYEKLRMVADITDSFVNVVADIAIDHLETWTTMHRPCVVHVTAPIQRINS